MALGMTAGLLLAGGAYSASTQAIGANQQAKAITKQAEYNAQIFEQNASMIKAKADIQDYQFNRSAARARGKGIAHIAGSGFTLGGSPLNMLIDSESQMQFDKAIEEYNSKIDYNYAMSGAKNTRQQGAVNAKSARFSGYTNAFTTMLTTGGQIGMLNLAPRIGKL